MSIGLGIGTWFGYPAFLALLSRCGWEFGSVLYLEFGCPFFVYVREMTPSIYATTAIQARLENRIFST